MFRRKLTHKYVEDYLSDPIKHWHWDPEITPIEKEKARKALLETLRRAKELLPRARVYGFDPLEMRQDGHGYLIRLLRLKHVLADGKWNEACSKLHNVLHSDCVEDRRVLYTIIGLLEEHL